MGKIFTLIDTYGFLFRNFYALPPLKSKDGIPTGMLTGFLNFIASLEKDFSTDYLLFALDSKEKESFRKKIYKKYKENRPQAPQDLKIQLPIAIEMIKEMGFASLEMAGFESDDIIASLSKLAANNGMKVRIVTHDKDMYQLIDDEKIVVFDPAKKEIIDEKKCFEKFGVLPKYFVDFQALIGDSSDNIPGVKGIGVKTAAKLINRYYTLENIYSNIETISGTIKRKLLEGKESAFLSRKLVRLRDDLFENINFEKFEFPSNPIIRIENRLKSLQIVSVLKRIKEKASIGKIAFNNEIVFTKKRAFEILSQANGKVIAFDTETDGLENPNLVGFSFAFENNKAYYIPIAHNYLGAPKQMPLEDALDVIKNIFSNKVVGHNLKFDMKVLKKYGIDMIVPYGDSMIFCWIDSPDSPVGLDSAAKRYLHHENIKFKDIVKKGGNFSQVRIEDGGKYAAEDAFISLRLFEYLKNRFWDDVKWDIEKIEMPFVKLLAEMELEGIEIDTDYLEKLEKDVNHKISKLKREIYFFAQEEFNINSTKQLSSILFEKLKLPKKKKTKTGYSTDESVLKKLQNIHPIVKKLLEYRKMDKLLNTYIVPLLEYGKKDKNHKIYTTFLQTGTTTGRLSSKNPNLQNIPTTTEINIRDAFVSKKLFVSLDYSQIELRLLAHFSKDTHLVKAFWEDKDIHLETAIKIFGEDKAHKFRNVAKSINFGLIYGMGARRLSETIGGG
jgi:DNA polymerase-1